MSLLTTLESILAEKAILAILVIAVSGYVLSHFGKLYDKVERSIANPYCRETLKVLILLASGAILLFDYKTLHEIIVVTTLAKT